jgi:endonuclease YncB( thermonuclease family)
MRIWDIQPGGAETMSDGAIRMLVIRAAASAALALAVAVLLTVAAPEAAQREIATAHSRTVVAGRAEVIDGDTLLVGGIRVRLEGIDAPEIDQRCTDAGGKRWRCGVAAARLLSRLIAGRTVSCEPHGVDLYRRVLGVCHAGGLALNDEIVRQGLAWAFVRYSQAYVAIEAEARRAGAGVWSGHAVPPWDYRKHNR